MKRPLVCYRVASPRGDVAVDDGNVDHPLEGDPLRTPYRTYFHAITDFLSENHFKTLLHAINAHLGKEVEISRLQKIIVRAEKHGALYHPASVECITDEGNIVVGLNVAVTDTGRNALEKEFSVLRALHEQYNYPYIPKPLLFDNAYSMAFLLEEWFEEYHEFHISASDDGNQLLKLWAYGSGERSLTPAQAFEIYRQAAQILTCYYDLRDFCLIYPWHHAAGDFVVKIEDSPSPFAAPSPLAEKGKGEGDLKDKIDVKLTTVRGYEPFMGIDEDDMVSPILALFYFLLHLTIQMRLDRLDGVGDIVLADDSCIDATVTGFFQGIEKKDNFRDCCGSVTSFLELLKSFTEEELFKTLSSIVAQFDQTRGGWIIQEHLRDHANRLYLTLRNFLL